MTVRTLLALVATAACGGHAQHPGLHAGEHCLSPTEVLDASAHVEDTTTDRSKAKLRTRQVIQIFDDLVATDRAETTGAPAPPLTSGPCLPDELVLEFVFTGDEKPIEALARGFYATDLWPQTGLRDGVGTFWTKDLAALLALPNVQTVDEPDPGHVTLNDASRDTHAEDG